jgi:hypothetical protein
LRQHLKGTLRKRLHRRVPTLSSKTREGLGFLRLANALGVTSLLVERRLLRR